LAKHLRGDDTVIDIGANCGDTVAAMLDQQPSLGFLCVEPDDCFYGYLKRNSDNISSVYKKNNLYLAKNLVGKSVKSASLVGSGGTKRSVTNDMDSNVGSDAFVSSTLDELVAIHLSCSSHVRLIKSDVDGFDYDVIDSAVDTIKNFTPLIYFECLCYTVSQKMGFENTIERLSGLGYINWIVFDNFGEVVLRCSDYSIVCQMINYIWRQNLERSTRTIYYIDVLAYVDGDSQLVDEVVDGYLSL
jgi:FkbM family methyltransferase